MHGHIFSDSIFCFLSKQVNSGIIGALQESNRDSVVYWSLYGISAVHIIVYTESKMPSQWTFVGGWMYVYNYDENTY